MEKLEVRNVLREAKKLLLDDENINDAHYITNSRVIVVQPNQAKSYIVFEDVFENFLNEFEEVEINGNIYSIIDYDHFNSTIFSVTLRLKSE